MLKIEILKRINKDWKIAEEELSHKSTVQNELDDVFKSFFPKVIEPSENKVKYRFVDAISKGLYQCMERYDNLVLLGQDIAAFGGVFKVTNGFFGAVWQRENTQYPNM